MSSSFQQEKVKVISTHKGSHGDHWFGLYREKDTQLIMDTVIKTVHNGNKFFNEQVVVITDNAIRVLVKNSSIMSGFPFCKGTRHESFEIHSIEEWEHSENLEARIMVKHSSGCAISFFATDYSFNKDIYKNQKQISVNMIGLAYIIQDFDSDGFNAGTEMKFSDDFCGYMPGEVQDDINFIGCIQNIQEYSLGDIEGFILRMKITAFCDIDMFVAKSNVQTNIEINKRVCGYAWIQGTLEE